MAREKRQISPTGIYHVLLRGIDELFSEKDDFEEFIAVLNRYFENSEAGFLRTQNFLYRNVYCDCSCIDVL